MASYKNGSITLENVYGKKNIQDNNCRMWFFY